MDIIGSLKELISLADRAKNRDIYKRLVELQDEILQVVNEKVILQGQVIALDEQLKIKDSLQFENNAYWIIKDSDVKEGPFCTFCWDNEKKLVRQHYNEAGQIWFCITHNLFSHNQRTTDDQGPTDNVPPNQIYDFSVISERDNTVDFEVWYFYNGAAGQDDISITSDLFSEDNRKLSSGGSSERVRIIGHKATARTACSVRLPKPGESIKSTKVRFSMYHSQKGAFEYFDFPFVKEWKKHNTA